MKPEQKTRRSAPAIMARLIGLVRPLLHIMLAAILLGTVGYLCAIFLTILAAESLVEKNEALFAPLVLLAVLRGLLHYVEQYCNHFIAFKLLAIIRHEVFASLRRLCPAKLEGRDKGNLISILTSDIELLEVFYAHTISPIAIAVLTSAVMVLYIGRIHPAAGVYALCAYLIVGVGIPLWNGRRGGEAGMTYRNEFGALNSFVLDSLRGLDETLQYGQGEKRAAQMNARSEELGRTRESLSRMEGAQRALTNLVILLASFGMLFLTLHLRDRGVMDEAGVLLCTAAMMGSFGPTAALSSLSNNLNQTLASGERVLEILEEEPLVAEIPRPEESAAPAGTRTAETGEKSVSPASESRGMAAGGFTGAAAERVSFAYGAEEILHDCSLEIRPGQIVGIHGPSGSGKSTLLKLFMRFWDVNDGRVTVSGRDVREIPTAELRDTESFVTQETHLFHDSIANNIAIGRPGATREEIMEAARKASIHDFILTLPHGYDTEVGELGDTLSGGERQRLGLARAFLHDAPFLLLDEPTSNLDALNEGAILKSLAEAGEHQTVVLVSHRRSTLRLADVVYEMDGGRRS
ncbi:MAG: ABC transporter ATP-binding protein/permease [Lachnospiraceae bacterium]|nr:ABC transporter ATP-binding protein/permease [Lachnospiraceae bacterium]